MSAYPTYEYVTGEDAFMWFENPWLVRVHTSRGLLNFDQFVYFPNQNAPSVFNGNRFERLGEWVYLHE